LKKQIPNNMVLQLTVILSLNRKRERMLKLKKTKFMGNSMDLLKHGGEN